VGQGDPEAVASAVDLPDRGPGSSAKYIRAVHSYDPEYLVALIRAINVLHSDKIVAPPIEFDVHRTCIGGALQPPRTQVGPPSANASLPSPVGHVSGSSKPVLGHLTRGKPLDLLHSDRGETQRTGQVPTASSRQWGDGAPAWQGNAMCAWARGHELLDTGRNLGFLTVSPRARFVSVAQASRTRTWVSVVSLETSSTDGSNPEQATPDVLDDGSRACDYRPSIDPQEQVDRTHIGLWMSREGNSNVRLMASFDATWRPYKWSLALGLGTVLDGIPQASAQAPDASTPRGPKPRCVRR